MNYASPKTLRRRQIKAEAKTLRPRRKAVVQTDSEWGQSCDFHINEIHAKAAYPDSVAAHARALVHMAIERRATELSHSLHCARWKATVMARIELLGAAQPLN